ncbi:MAG: hypothetical protein K2Y51_04725 [Gammaproteobacteria bacterium]|nr:hypothetical protein [Gammaproteobacteria bacterium]
MNDTQTLPRRGPLHARLAPHARGWREVNGYQVCAQLQGAVLGADPWLADQTHLPRLGLKGRGAADWLAAAGVTVPDAPNLWLRDATGVRVARLGAQDFLLEAEAEADGAALARLAAAWSADSGRRGQLVPRQHALASFLVGGERAADLFVRLCAVDLRPTHFAVDAVAQTQVALTTAIVLRDTDIAPRYRLYVDTSLALYLWDRLHEVTVALGGGALGAEQLPDVGVL